MDEKPKPIAVYVTTNWVHNAVPVPEEYSEGEETTTSTETQLKGNINVDQERYYYYKQNGEDIPLVKSSDFAEYINASALPVVKFLLMLESVVNPKGSFVYNSHLFATINVDIRRPARKDGSIIGTFEPWELERLGREIFTVIAIAKEENYIELLSPRAVELFTELLAHAGNIKSSKLLSELAKDARIQTSALKLARASHEMSTRKYLTAPQMRGLDETMCVHRNLIARYFALRK